MKKITSIMCVVLCVSLVAALFGSGNLFVNAASYDLEIKKSFNDYVLSVGNEAEPEKMVDYINKQISPYSVSLASNDDYFIYHAEDGVYDEGDSTYPLNIAGHNGYMSAILQVSNGDTVVGTVGTVATIPYETENLGTLTSDVYSADNTNFTTTNGNITGYSGTAEKIIIPASFSGTINLKDCAGKDNVKAVIIGDKNTNAKIAIAAYSFSGWANLRAVVLPGRIHGSIGDYAFSHNNKLKYVWLPAGVNGSNGSGYGSIGYGAFSHNPNLSTCYYRIAAGKDTFPSAQYRANIFENTAIRDYYLPAWFQYASATQANVFGLSPSYSSGTTVVLTNAQNGTATFARAAVLAQDVADDVVVTSSNAATVKSNIIAAYSSKISNITAEWKDAQYSALVLNLDGQSIAIKCNPLESYDIPLEMEMQSGATLRFEDTIGMKFTANIYGLENSINEEYVSSIDVGILICPTDYILSTDFTKETLNITEKDYLDIKGEYIQSAENSGVQYHSVVGVISEISASNYNRLFSARAYAEIVYSDGTFIRIYADFDRENNSARLSELAKAQLKDTTGLNSNQISYLNTVVSSIEKDKPVIASAASNWIDSQKGGSDDAANQMRNQILVSTNGTPDSSVYTGTTYYISNSGKDSYFYGTSQQRPCKTVSYINSKLKAGDKVLFECGGVYRETFYAKNGVYYGSYGEGDKPCIYGSRYNYAEETWSNYSDNVWTISSVSGATNYSEDDAGIIIFNHGEFAGVKKTQISELTDNGDFYFDASANKLYLYSSIKPSEKYYSIEIGLRNHIIVIEGGLSNVTVENLTLKYTGGLGISCGSGVQNITVKNCEIGFIGGSYMAGTTTRYGNGIEFWNACTNVLVENCWIYQIYDSALTHQGRVSGDVVFTADNVTFKNNLTEYSGLASIEYWASGGSDGNGHYNLMKDITYTGNILRFAGCGWGSVGRTTNSYHIYGGNQTNPSSNFVITDNVFDTGRCGLVFCGTDNAGVKLPTLSGNTYIQPKNGILGKYGYNATVVYYFDENVAENVKNIFKDTAATVIVYK